MAATHRAVDPVAIRETGDLVRTFSSVTVSRQEIGVSRVVRNKTINHSDALNTYVLEPSGSSARDIIWQDIFGKPTVGVDDNHVQTCGHVCLRLVATFRLVQKDVRQLICTET